MDKIELNEDELEMIVGGLDFDVLNKDNMLMLVRALLVGDIEIANDILLKFLDEGSNPNVLERLIDRFANSKEGKMILKNILKAYL